MAKGQYSPHRVWSYVHWQWREVLTTLSMPHEDTLHMVPSPTFCDRWPTFEHYTYGAPRPCTVSIWVLDQAASNARPSGARIISSIASSLKRRMSNTGEKKTREGRWVQLRPKPGRSAAIRVFLRAPGKGDAGLPNSKETCSYESVHIRSRV